MRNLFIAISITLVLSSCEKVEELTQFEMEYTNSIIIAAGTPLDLPLQLNTPSLETNYTEVFSQYDTRPDKIDEIILKEVDFTISSPEEGNFNFLESVELSIAAEELEKAMVASKTEIENTYESMLVLETGNVNLKDYLSVSEFMLDLNIVTDELLTQDLEIEIHTVFFVDARVLGQ